MFQFLIGRLIQVFSDSRTFYHDVFCMSTWYNITKGVYENTLKFMGLLGFIEIHGLF